MPNELLNEFIAKPVPPNPAGKGMPGYALAKEKYQEALKKYNALSAGKKGNSPAIQKPAPPKNPGNKAEMDKWSAAMKKWQLAMIAHTKKWNATQPKKGKAPPAPVTKKPSAPTVAVKGKGGVPYDPKDVEILNLQAAFKNELLKKYKHDTWAAGYKNTMKKVKDATPTAPDAKAYLTGQIKLLNPSWKPFNPNTKLKPGEWAGLPIPSDPLSPAAQKLAPNTADVLKKQELEAKAAEIIAKLAAMDKEREKLRKARDKAEKEAKKMQGIDPKLLAYFSYIDKHCSDFLKVAKNAKKLLWRGQDDASAPVFVGRPREDRKAKDSDQEAQKMLDQILLNNGFKALRSNSIFCSGSKYHAEGYGTLYCIFPKNGFQYTWSTKNDDLVIDSVEQLLGEYADDDGDWDDEGGNLYYDYEETLSEYQGEDPRYYYIDTLDFTDEDKVDAEVKKYVSALTKDPNYKEYLKKLKQWDKLDAYEDDQKDIIKVYISVLEAFLKIPKALKYHIMSISDTKTLIKDALKDLKAIETKEKKKNGATTDAATGKAVIKRWGFIHDRLDAALKAGHEICMLGEYVAVDAELHEAALKKYFLGTETTNKNNYYDD